MLQGLYKVEMHTVHGTRRGVLYCYDGKMMGGNSAYGFVGTYEESVDGEVSVEISTIRHNNDPNFQPKRDRIVELYDLADRGEAIVICLDEFGPLNLQPQPGGYSWAPRAWSGHAGSGQDSMMDSPWLRMFRNARVALG